MSPEIAVFFRELYKSRDSILMELCSDYQTSAGGAGTLSRGDVEEKSVEDLFADFYAERRGGETPTEEDATLLRFAGELLSRAGVRAAPGEKETQKLLDWLLEQEATK